MSLSGTDKSIERSAGPILNRNAMTEQPIVSNTSRKLCAILGSDAGKLIGYTESVDTQVAL